MLGTTKSHGFKWRYYCQFCYKRKNGLARISGGTDKKQMGNISTLWIQNST